jgi:CheY-like chemotaxis protein
MDDEEGVRSLLGRLLQRMGHEVELVEDGRRAIEAYGRAKMQGCPFDAVIVDLTVSGGTGGREAIQPLREIDPAVKAIVISGYASDPVLLEPERYGFKGALAKPFGSAKLRNVLAQVLG